jgi:hypothetical protein
MAAQLKIVGFEVLTAVSMKITVFWVVAPCSLVEPRRQLSSQLKMFTN